MPLCTDADNYNLKLVNTNKAKKNMIVIHVLYFDAVVHCPVIVFTDYIT